MAGETKGITVKIDAELHAEIKEYVEKNNMTMAEFITLSADDELHPKIQQRGEEQMGSMRTLAFQVPEDLFMRVKDYLQRNNMKQREFVIGLIEKELDREQIEREKLNQQGDSDIESDADGGHGGGGTLYQYAGKFIAPHQNIIRPAQAQPLDSVAFESLDDGHARYQRQQPPMAGGAGIQRQIVGGPQAAGLTEPAAVKPSTSLELSFCAHHGPRFFLAGHVESRLALL